MWTARLVKQLQISEILSSQSQIGEYFVCKRFLHEDEKRYNSKRHHVPAYLVFAIDKQLNTLISFLFLTSVRHICWFYCAVKPLVTLTVYNKG